jgi:hypothetical protein
MDNAQYRDSAVSKRQKDRRPKHYRGHGWVKEYSNDCIHCRPNPDSVITELDLRYHGYPDAKKIADKIKNGGVISTDDLDPYQQRNLRLSIEDNQNKLGLECASV